MPTLKLNPTGDGYAWPDETQDLVDQAHSADPPAEEAFAHYTGRALDNLAWPFREKPILTAILSVFSEEVAALDREAWAVVASRWVDTAEGPGQLLPLGRLVSAPVQAQFADDLNRNLIDLWAQLSVATRSQANSAALWENLFAENRLHATPGDYTKWISLNDANAGLATAIEDELWPSMLAEIAVPWIWPAGIVNGTIDYTLEPGLYGSEGMWNEEVAFERLDL